MKMKKILIIMIVACSGIINAFANANVEAEPAEKPKHVIEYLESIIKRWGKPGGEYTVERSPISGHIVKSVRTTHFIAQRPAKFDELTSMAFKADENLAYLFQHIPASSTQSFDIEIYDNNSVATGMRIRNPKDEMWLLCTKNPENPLLRDVYALVWHNDGLAIEGDVYMVTSKRPDLMKTPEPTDHTFRIEGRVGEEIKDSLYNIYIANSMEELNRQNENDYVACVPVINKRFEFTTKLDHRMVGRLRCIFPNGELCSAWIDLDFVPGETYHITVHNGRYDEDVDYESRVGAYSGKSLARNNYRRANVFSDTNEMKKMKLFLKSYGDQFRMHAELFENYQEQLEKVRKLYYMAEDKARKRDLKQRVKNLHKISQTEAEKMNDAADKITSLLDTNKDLDFTKEPYSDVLNGVTEIIKFNDTIIGKLQHMTVTEDAFDANEINKRIKYHYNQIEKNNNRLYKYVDSLADRLADSVRIDSVEIKPQIKIDSKAPKLQTLPYSEE